MSMEDDIRVMELRAQKYNQEYSKEKALIEIMRLEMRAHDLRVTVESLESEIEKTTALIEQSGVLHP